MGDPSSSCIQRTAQWSFRYFCHSRFGDPQMVAQLAADIFSGLRTPTTQQVTNADPERLASLDVVVGQ